MKKEWKDAVVTDIGVVAYVPSGAGIRHCTDRNSHAFLLNGPADSAKNYHFPDGQVLKTRPSDLFYLPKGSSYRVDAKITGGCWVMNFDLLTPLADAPFVIRQTNPAAVTEIFKEAEEAFRVGGDARDATIRRAVYSIIMILLEEQRKRYVTGSRMQQFQNALDRIDSEFADRELTVHVLAAQCGVSDTYFRRIFHEHLGISPQEYIIRRKIHYAKQLLTSGHFSVSKIAVMCGYCEQSHFSREFTKRTGVSPRNYAKRKKAE